MGHQIQTFLRDIHAFGTYTDLIDISVISLFFYILLKWLQQETSRTILCVVAPVGFVFVMARLLHLYLTSLLFQTGLTMITVAIVVVFQEDFRRAFESLASWKFSHRNRRFSARNRVIGVLTECARKFAQNKLWCPHRHQGAGVS